MSDTPRSNDAGKVVIPSGGGVRMVNPELGEKPWVVPFTFAQELERENAELSNCLDWAETILCNSLPMQHCAVYEWNEIISKWRDSKHAINSARAKEGGTT